MGDLKSMIQAAGHTQTSVARALGYSTSNISRWAARKMDIPTKTIRPLAELLEVDPVAVLAIATALPDQGAAA